MIIVGLTGSIGMGKSTTADMFRAENIPVHDADKSVHQLYENEAVASIEPLFPSAIVNGKIDRQKLGKIVLGDRDKLRQLQNIVHPLVREKELQFLQNSRSQNQPIVVLDIPLLLETGGDKRVDKIVVVTASAAEQKRRVLARPQMNEEKFSAILKQQMPDHEKRQKADFIIDTELGMQSARLAVKAIISELLAE